MTTKIPQKSFDFLNRLKKNNDRDWFAEHKPEFKEIEKEVKSFFTTVYDRLNVIDEVDKMKMFRIYRDVRFSKDKTPYKTHLAASFHRLKPQLRGGYYVRLKPGDSFIATGFWNPNKEDLHRIRKEFETDANEFRKIINRPTFKKFWGALTGEEVKTAPRGFNKAHENIDLIKKKQFIFIRKFTDKEVLSESFMDEILLSFKTIRPYFNFMSEVLTTDLNGVPLYE